MKSYKTFCKVEFQPFNRSYSQITFFVFVFSHFEYVSCELDKFTVNPHCMLRDTPAARFHICIIIGIQGLRMVAGRGSTSNCSIQYLVE